MGAILAPAVFDRLHKGGVIPAHPLALKEDLSIDEERQRRLTRYYISCGVHGIAIGVHTTQFEIRKPEFNYFKRVLEITADEIRRANVAPSFIKVAGICGPIDQAIEEAETAKKLGFDLGLLSMGGLDSLSERQLIERAKAVAEVIPVFGFYLQPAVGGRILTYSFWEEFCSIDHVFAIKVAPFNRYYTLDVVRAVSLSGRSDEIALYTGNDDNIVLDLITPYIVKSGSRLIEKWFVGGLLGHYAVWTKKSVDLFNYLKDGLANGNLDYNEALKLAVKVTDMNAALFDSANNFKGSIAGIHEVLRRQGLLEGIWCLNPEERLSPNQAADLDRVTAQYKELIDDEYVKEFILEDNGSKR
ncbi:MAG: dihydrodipicolinate synthase family protein [Fermentimonas sp.]|jgi:dihydrodipicolinate synthase/N-acetylneuraminate lyase